MEEATTEPGRRLGAISFSGLEDKDVGVTSVSPDPFAKTSNPGTI